MILFSHATGNANVRQAALALAESDLLAEFWTCVGWNPDSPLNRLLPSRWRREAERRALPASLRAVSHYRPWRELARLACARAGLRHLTRHEHGLFSIDAVFHALDRAVAQRVTSRPGLRAVYAYEDGALATFAAAAARGLQCVYDLPIGYWRAAHAIFDEEKLREPAWACTLSGTFDSPEKLARKDEELRLADTVLVASSFTSKTLALAPFPVKAVRKIFYGAPPDVNAPCPRRRDGKLRVLFVGALGQRKGLSYLLDAVALLGAQFELTLLGRKTSEICQPLNEAVRRHRWIPSLPHQQVLEEMSRHDILVFPSLFEGFGLVILEAMSQGLPVITTPHTGGPDVIDDGADGFVVPIQSTEAIAEKLDLLAGDRVLAATMGEAARAKAKTLSWSRYRAQITETIGALFDQPAL